MVGVSFTKHESAEGRFCPSFLGWDLLARDHAFAPAGEPWRGSALAECRSPKVNQQVGASFLKQGLHESRSIQCDQADQLQISSDLPKLRPEARNGL